VCCDLRFGSIKMRPLLDQPCTVPYLVCLLCSLSTAAAVAAVDAAASDSRHGSSAAQRASRVDWRCRLLHQRCWGYHPRTPSLPVWRPQQLEPQASAGHAECHCVNAVCIRHIIHDTQVRKVLTVRHFAMPVGLQAPLVLLPKLECAFSNVIDSWCYHPGAPSPPVKGPQQLEPQVAAGHGKWRGVYTVCVRHIVYNTQVR
jgi:hypothetical protein